VVSLTTDRHIDWQMTDDHDRYDDDDADDDD